jgi:hypothetical protein
MSRRLREITPADRFYNEVRQVYSQLGRILAEYEAQTTAGCEDNQPERVDFVELLKNVMPKGKKGKLVS